jgi:hypothetical protein
MLMRNTLSAAQEQLGAAPAGQGRA